MRVRTKNRFPLPAFRTAMTMTTTAMTGEPSTMNSAREKGIHPVRRAMRIRIKEEGPLLKASAKRGDST